MKQHTFVVWFCFTDDDQGSRRSTLIDATTGRAAARWVRTLYTGVDRIFKVEKIS